MKRCYKCHTEQEETAFSKGQRRCKSCARVYRVKYYHEHKEQAIAYQKIYAQTEAGKAAFKRAAQKRGKEKKNASHKAWRMRNKDKLNKARQERMKNDPAFRLKLCLRQRVSQTVRKGYKTSSSLKMLGCSFEEFVSHIEKQWLLGMNWQNHGIKGWHLDHIRPCASFDLTDPEQQKACFHWSNYQPLWAVDNLVKSDNWAS